MSGAIIAAGGPGWLVMAAQQAKAAKAFKDGKSKPYVDPVKHEDWKRPKGGG